jgi:predicted Zn-dependent protease
MYGQINVEMGKVNEGLEPYRHAVQILPDAPLIRIALAAALLGTENPKYTAEAAQELQTAISQDEEDSFGWYELAQAYGRQGQTGKAELATAERYFVVDAFPQAMQFAVRAQRQLQPGSTDWQRAQDIFSISQTQAKNNR